MISLLQKFDGWKTIAGIALYFGGKYGLGESEVQLLTEFAGQAVIAIGVVHRIIKNVFGKK